MSTFILFLSFVIAAIGGCVMILSLNSGAGLITGLLFACGCGLTGSRLALIAEQRKTLRDIRNGTLKLLDV